MIRSVAEPAPLRVAEPEAFLWIGRMNENKRPQAVVELAERLPRARFRMVLAGSRGEGEPAGRRGEGWRESAARLSAGTPRKLERGEHIPKKVRVADRFRPTPPTPHVGAAHERRLSLDRTRGIGLCPRLAQRS